MQILIKQLEGRDHYVVPTVLITTGVHNGSSGPLYYPADGLRESARLWNAKPVVVYHPEMMHGGYADNPDVFNRQKIGTLFNARFDGNRLRADAWIDKERVAKVDRRVLDAIQSRRMMEVSTGLLTELQDQQGVFNGKAYIATVTRMTPDHLAVLPDQEGACSIADGAGLIRNIIHELELSLPSTV